MLSKLSEKLYGSGNQGWLELSGLILKMLKLFVLYDFTFQS